MLRRKVIKSLYVHSNESCNKLNKTIKHILFVVSTVLLSLLIIPLIFTISNKYHVWMLKILLLQKFYGVINIYVLTDWQRQKEINQIRQVCNIHTAYWYDNSNTQFVRVSTRGFRNLEPPSCLPAQTKRQTNIVQFTKNVNFVNKMTIMVSYYSRIFTIIICFVYWMLLKYTLLQSTSQFFEFPALNFSCKCIWKVCSLFCHGANKTSNTWYIHNNVL